MEFIEKLLEANPQKRGQYDNLNAIEAGKFELSIQGSRTHYCSPRESIKPNQYKLMEVAIFAGDEWLSIDSVGLRDFPRFRELDEKSDSSAYEVYAYVPTDLIESLYQYLKTL